MKSISRIFKYDSLLKIVSFIALTMAMINVNTACAFIMHQPKLPESVKKLRKF